HPTSIDGTFKVDVIYLSFYMSGAISANATVVVSFEIPFSIPELCGVMRDPLLAADF
ncbi:hypothetical protein AVEN_214869-1, partial [Araneus ventricosus]